MLKFLIILQKLIYQRQEGQTYSSDTFFFMKTLKSPHVLGIVYEIHYIHACKINNEMVL